MFPRMIVFSDLDGTLLDTKCYSWRPARPALAELRRRGIPLVLVSSKTRAEMQYLRRKMGLPPQTPYIVENGGAVCWGARAIPLGTPARDLALALERLAKQTGVTVRGFHQMTVEEIAALTGLAPAQAHLSQQREWNLPFRVLAGDPSALTRAIESHGLRWTRGGRFFHIHGRTDKADAVRLVLRRFPGAISLGLGDAWNDISFLQTVDHPVLVRSAHSRDLKRRLPGVTVTQQPGPRGWNQAVLARVRSLPLLP